MNIVQVNDAVKDPMDGQWRIVIDVREDQVFMKDGGVMGLDECEKSDILLPSECDTVGDYAQPIEEYYG